MTHQARINTRRWSWAAMVAWSFSISPTNRSTSVSHPSFFTAFTPSSFDDVVSIRFLNRSTWSIDNRAWRMKRSRVAMYKSRWLWKATKSIKSNANRNQMKHYLQSLQRAVEQCPCLIAIGIKDVWKFEILLTRCSKISECDCVCAANSPTPSLTPSQSSQSSPRQHRSFTSATTFNTFDNLDKSAWSSPTPTEESLPKCSPIVEAENIDEAEEKSGATGRIKFGGEEEEEKSGKVRELRRRPEGIHTAAASRLFMMRSANIHIFCHCSISDGIFCLTILQSAQLSA